MVIKMGNNKICGKVVHVDKDEELLIQMTIFMKIMNKTEFYVNRFHMTESLSILFNV